VNGVVGLKPSIGLIMSLGVVPITGQQDTPGPMGRHVIDLAIALAVLQVTGRGGSGDIGPAGRQVVDYVSALDPDCCAARGSGSGIGPMRTLRSSRPRSTRWRPPG